MKVYLMRHGPAEDYASSGRDFDRVLTAAGRERVRRVTEKLIERGETPRAIFSSPLARALQTAEVVAAMAPPAEAVAVRREIAPGGDAQGLIKELQLAEAKRIMLVGHEPDISWLCSQLLSGEWSGGFEKAMVVGLRLKIGEPTELRFVLEPKTLHWRE